MDRKNRILIVEDEDGMRNILKEKLSRHFDIEAVANSTEAFTCLSNDAFDVVLLDMRLTGTNEKDGLRLLTSIKDERPMLPVIVMTAYGDIETAVEAMKMGANDFVDKGSISSPSEFVPILNEAIRKNREKLQINARLAEQSAFVNSNLVGNSTVMAPIRKSIDLAATDGYCSVLILGETGTGKEVIARAIHEQGIRKDGPFVAVSIAGLNPTLIESELFGHEKGAFTGADKSKTGYIEQANGGVLFLDEIGELNPDIQAKMLRFLEDKKVYKVGSTIGRPVNLQIIYATNRELRKMIDEGKFRHDLYYRIKTIEMNSPPLRERQEDIPLLADHFLQQLRIQGRTQLAGFSQQAIQLLKSYLYPGNVRELKNIVEWAVLLAGQNQHWIIETEDLPIEIHNPATRVEGRYSLELGNDLNVDRACALVELSCVERALKATKGVKGKSEQLLGYSNRQTMRRRIQKIRETYPDIWDNFPITAKFYYSIDIDDDEQ